MFKFMFLFLSISLSHLAVGQPILPSPVKISPHVYAWIGPYGGPNKENRGFRMNMAFVVGSKFVAVIDTGFYPNMAAEMVNQISQITSLPIRYAINTNSQAHRFFGNQVFQKLGAKIVAHKKEVQRMQANANLFSMFIEQNQGFKKGSIAIPPMPNLVIEKATVLDLGGGISIKLSAYGSAHTPSPLIVEIPSDNIVYAGDVLYGDRLLAIVSGGNIKQWLGYYNHLGKFKDYVFIPGHGKPGTLTSFKKSTHDYLSLLHSHMSKMLNDGIELMEAVDKLDQQAFRNLINFKELAGRNANRAYLELEQEFFQ